jgi:CDP-glucose 4,6-dehydratase
MIQELSVYKGKRVLITGHTGFKGSWLSIWLNILGAEVIGYALNPYTGKDNFVRSGVAGKIIDIRSDIRDFAALGKAFEEHEPEFVFHLAAQSLVRPSYDDPKETFDVNVGGTVNVIENCRRSKSLKIAVIATSDKCYRNKEWAWGYRENDELGGHDPYSASKACAELVADSYRRAFLDLPGRVSGAKALSSVRAGNVIGGGDWREHRILPDCIRSLERGESIPVRNPEATRPWQFVLEPLGGYLLLGARMYRDRGAYSGAWNFGPEQGSHITVRDLVEKVLNEYGSGDWYHEQDHDSKKETACLALDISKARSSLGWKPLLGIDDAVRKTIEWYLNYQTRPDMFGFCRGQINDYMEK